MVLQFKVLVDAGLVGLPNVDKSTFLVALSAAKPKIVDYSFTTLQPNLEMVSYCNNRSPVMADIPGIIGGAIEGKGLGFRFLRHIERNLILLFTVPIDSPDITAEYWILCRGLEEYSPSLINKRHILTIIKTDMADNELIDLVSETLLEEVPMTFIPTVA